MKNLLKKLHIVSREFDDSDGSTKDSAPGKSPESSSHEKISPSLSCPSASIADVEPKVLSGFSGWLSSVTRHHYPSSNSSVVSSNASEAKRFLDSGSLTQLSSSVGETDLMSGLEADRACLSSPLLQEEYQIQLALALSAKEDPEAAQIEAVKQISLGSCPPLNTPSEVVAYRYWNYNALGYDDKILDGFYDLYGILTESTSREMPSLVDLQGVPLSDNINWEVVLVNRETDDDLSRLEGRALTLSVNSRFESHGTIRGDLLQGLAALVSNHMGGPVADPDSMLRSWKALSDGLRTRSGSMVLPLGSLTIGLARHRALLFKVLADAMGIPCRLVKGRQYTGSDDVSMNIVKVDDGREYIIDLMGAPGTLIPFDALGGQAVYEEAASCESSPDVGKLDVLLCTGKTSSADECSRYDNSEFNLTSGRCFPYDGDVGRGSLDETSATGILGVSSAEKEASTSCNSQEFRFDSAAPCESGEELKSSRSIKLNHPYTHTRSPSSTESINFPVVRSMKIKDVSQYMIDAAKENPQLAQKLCDVLRESGVVAPSNLFSEILTKSIEVHGNEEVELPGEGSNEKNKNAISDVAQGDAGAGSLLSSQISPGYPSKAFLFGPQMIQQKPVEGLGTYLPLDIGSMNTASHHVPPIEASGFPLVAVQEKPILKIRSRVPVAAVAATAAVVASSMVVAATKSSTDSNMEVPVAAAATATAAAVVATTAAVSCQYEQLDPSLSHFPLGALYGCLEDFTCTSDREVGILHKRNTQEVLVSAAEEWTNTPYRTTDRESDKSVGNESVRSDGALDDVAEFEILWEEITLGERIGLGSYGEVYRGDWHGTDVAVKRFLDQDLSGIALEEFKTEVRIMKRLRHPNVVLFMGAVIHAPNLAIVTEFLHRGSLYRLLHRPNSQIDERRRLRMALDVARGMNYLHSCTPVIVHRDLKSPNLLVDKNWGVKVCDFGLSRTKHSTFLSSRSTSGTAEWMAPEVLRNEPSDEKCDVYSYGVILWELATLQQPWAGMNPMQVVGAVGFQHRCLEIPDGVDPAVAEIIRECWKTDPRLRPSFADIMTALKPLQKPITKLHTREPTASDRFPLLVDHTKHATFSCMRD